MKTNILKPISVVIFLIAAGTLLFLGFKSGGPKSNAGQLIIGQETDNRTQKLVDEVLNKNRNPDQDSKTDAQKPSQDEIQTLILKTHISDDYLDLSVSDKVDFADLYDNYRKIETIGDNCQEISFYLGDLANQSPTTQKLVDNSPFKDDQGGVFIISGNYELMRLVFNNLPVEDEYEDWYEDDFQRAKKLVEDCT